MGLTIKSFRESFGNLVGKDLIEAGFKMDKNITWFNKKEGKNKIKIFLHCYDFTPSKIEFGLIFQIWIAEIVNETEKFHNYINEFFSKEQPTFTFSEGEFIERTKHLEPKLRRSFTHVIWSADDVVKEIKISKELLFNNILPTLSTICKDFKTFQSYVLQNYKEIGISTLTNPSMIAMKLTGKKELEKVIDFYWNKQGVKDFGYNDLVRKYAEGMRLYAGLSI